MARRSQTAARDRVWPRFSRYVIAGGYIRPAPGAKASWYDPWEDFLAVRRSSASAEVALDSLLRLLDKTHVRKLTADEVIRVVQAHASPTKRPNEILRPMPIKYTFDERAVLGWVAEHGLLGLLHHRLQRTSLRRLCDARQQSRRTRRMQ